MSITIDAVVAVGPWGTTIDQLREWRTSAAAPGGAAEVPLPNVPGFVASPFINLTKHTQTACLATVAGLYPPPAPIGVVLASVLGDTATADRASQAVAAGHVPQPLLFYQSVPVSVLGRVSIEFPLTGPLVSVTGGPDLCAGTVETAELLLRDGGVERVLVTYVDAGGGPWRDSAARTLAEFHGESVVPRWDCCVSMLIRLPGDEEDALDPVQGRPDSMPGTVPRALAGFLDLAVRAAGRLAGGACARTEN